MFNIFKRNNNVTKLYQNLPPGDRIQKLFEEKIEQPLSEYGFRFVKSKNIFKRTVGDFTQEIIISKSKWNKADEVCSFWLVFGIIANTYNEWHTKRYGIYPLNNGVHGFYHNHLKNWKTEYKLGKYDLSKQDNNKVFNEIKMNIVDLVLPIFDKYADYEKAADTLMENKEYWWGAKIFDYYLISGNPDKAKAALMKSKEFFDNESDPETHRAQQFEAFQLRERKYNCR